MPFGDGSISTGLPLGNASQAFRSRKALHPFQCFPVLIWSCALVLYTYTIVLLVLAAVPACDGRDLVDSLEGMSRIVYVGEDACDPIRWTLWGDKQMLPLSKVRASSQVEPRTNREGSQIPQDSETGSLHDLHTAENPHETEHADRFTFYARVPPGARYPPDRVMYSKFFSRVNTTSHDALGNKTEVRNGTFVEVGAGDGLQDSLTLFFERELGWTGLLIEGSLASIPLLNASHRANETVKIYQAVCDSPGKVEMIGEGATAGLISSMNSVHLQKHGPTWGTKWRSPYEAECSRLEDILQTQRLSEVDLLTLNIEGAELQALRGMNFTAVSVRVVAIHILPQQSSLPSASGEPRTQTERDILEANGFCQAARVDGMEYWVSDEGLRRRYCAWSSFKNHP